MKTSTKELIELYSTMLRERGKMAEFRENNPYTLDNNLGEIFKIILERLKAENG